jgi:hypothetical protein
METDSEEEVTFGRGHDPDKDTVAASNNKKVTVKPDKIWSRLKVHVEPYVNKGP